VDLAGALKAASSSESRCKCLEHQGRNCAPSLAMIRFEIEEVRRDEAQRGFFIAELKRHHWVVNLRLAYRLPTPVRGLFVLFDELLVLRGAPGQSAR